MNFYNFYKNIIKTLNSALLMIRIQKINHRQDRHSSARSPNMTLRLYFVYLH